MESSNVTPRLLCDQIRQILDEKPSGIDKEALRLHLKSCADCRAELRLRAVMLQMLEEPPADLTDSVMNRIRAEQKKTAAHLRLIRRISAAAAAVVLIPAVVILAPILLHTGKSFSTEDIAREDEIRTQATAVTFPETAAAEVSEAFTAMIPGETAAPENEDIDNSIVPEAETAAPMFSTAPAAPAVPTPTPAPAAPETVPETAAVSAAPSYVGTKTQSATDRQTSPSTMASDSAAAAPQSELPVYAVLRALVGEKVLSAHIAAFSGNDLDLPVYLCGMFDITRQQFADQAQSMSLSFTEEELDLLFPYAEQ